MRAALPRLLQRGTTRTLGLMRAIAAASIAATLVQPVGFAAIVFLPVLITGEKIGSLNPEQAHFFVANVLFVAFAHVMLLGIPAFLLLRKWKRLHVRTISSAGFIAGAVPVAAFSWPLRRDWTGFSSGGNYHGHYVRFIEDGTFTLYGWLSYVESVATFGLLGVLGAVVFWIVWHRIAKLRSPHEA